MTQLRSPHSIYYYLLTQFAFGRFQWTANEKEILENNMEASDKILREKIPTRTLHQIKAMQFFIMGKKYASDVNKDYSIEDDIEILKFVLRKFVQKPKNVQEFSSKTKRLPWIQLADQMKRSDASIRQRFNLYVKPVIQSHLCGKNLNDIVIEMNQCIIDEQVLSKDQLNYEKFAPFEKAFLQYNINVIPRGRFRNESLWIAVKSRVEQGQKLEKFLSEEQRNILINEFEEYFKTL